VPARGPAEAVRALFDAAVAGDDHSAYATGALAAALRLEHEALTAFETAARQFTVRRIRVVRDDGTTASVALDGEWRMAYKDLQSGEWKSSTNRVRGRARVVLEDGCWLVADLPSTEGRSVVASYRETGERVRDGDLELVVRHASSWRREVYTFRLRNAGVRTLTPVYLIDERRVLRRLRMRLRLPIPLERTLEPSGTWTFRQPWQGRYRRNAGVIGIEALDDTGKTHTATVALRARRPLLAELATPVSLFEAAAVLLFVWGRLPGWVVTSFLPGLALVCAAVFRIAYLLYYVKYGDRGLGLRVLGTLALLELALGAWLVLREDFTLSGLFILATALALLTPTVAQLRSRA